LQPGRFAEPPEQVFPIVLVTAREIAAWYYEHHYDTVLEALEND
jgi:hypothetical protein